MLENAANFEQVFLTVDLAPPQAADIRGLDSAGFGHVADYREVPGLERVGVADRGIQSVAEGRWSLAAVFVQRSAAGRSGRGTIVSQ